jgi:hypothetical protein
MIAFNEEEHRELQKFADSSEAEQKAVLFETLMSLLAEAVETEDMAVIKSYARLATELWFEFLEEETND